MSIKSLHWYAVNSKICATGMLQTGHGGWKII